MSSKHPYKEIQLAQLRSFCRVATEGSFTAAAKLVQLSVPAVWQQVRALEKTLGATLVRRHGWKVELTNEGKVLLELVQPTVSNLDALPRLFAARRADLPQTLTVASTHGLIAYQLPLPVQQFVAKHPQVRLRLRPDVRAPELIRMLERGEADFGLVTYDRAETRSPYLDYEDLCDTSLYLLTSARHPLARKKRVTWNDVIPYPLILEPEDTLPRILLDRLLSKNGIIDKIHVVTENHTTDIIRRYVALEIGISFLFMDHHVHNSMRDLHTRKFEAAECLTEGLVTRKRANLSAPALELIELIRLHYVAQHG